MAIRLVLVLMIFGLIKVANASDLTITQQGDDFEMSVLQSSGDNLLQGSVIGDGHRVTSNQSNGAAATIDLINSGGGVDLEINQNSSTDSVSVTNICTNPGGCSISVDQR